MLEFVQGKEASLWDALQLLLATAVLAFAPQLPLQVTSIGSTGSVAHTAARYLCSIRYAMPGYAATFIARRSGNGHVGSLVRQIDELLYASFVACYILDANFLNFIIRCVCR